MVDLKEAHKHCRHHRDELMESTKCGCFYCLRVYDPADIKEWVREDNSALCPHCQVDSVIGDAAGYELTEDFLRAMHDRWFKIP